ncbi:MAG: GspH/FimT family pseudopilin [Saccharospirillum sp.]|nr:GspH/FimT family pseudopilin [Saccharospirillum sp.]
MHQRLHNGGFTLVELFICIAVISILATVSLPALQNLVEKVRAQQLQSELRTLFHTARMTAVHNQTTVTLCPLDDLNVCSNNWSSEISVFIDPDNTRRLMAPEMKIRVQRPLKHGKLRASSAGSSERRYFQYNPDGTVRGTIGHLIWCPSSKAPQNAFQLRINFGGRIRWAQDINGDGVAQMVDGSPISC